MSKKEQKLERKNEIVKQSLKLNKLHKQIVQWGYDKGIIQAGNPKAQWNKTLEEVNELKDAIEKNDKDAIKDAIGDSIVTLMLQAEIQKIELTDALQSVYDIISKRKGKMVDGTFVKEA